MPIVLNCCITKNETKRRYVSFYEKKLQCLLIYAKCNLRVQFMNVFKRFKVTYSVPPCLNLQKSHCVKITLSLSQCFHRNYSTRHNAFMGTTQSITMLSREVLSPSQCFHMNYSAHHNAFMELLSPSQCFHGNYSVHHNAFMGTTQPITMLLWNYSAHHNAFMITTQPITML